MRLDRLGVELAIDDVVVTSRNDGLALCKITRFTTMMVKLSPLDNTGHWRVTKEFAAYTNDVLKVDQQQAVVYLLSKGSTI